MDGRNFCGNHDLAEGKQKRNTECVENVKKKVTDILECLTLCHARSSACSVLGAPACLEWRASPDQNEMADATMGSAEEKCNNGRLRHCRSNRHLPRPACPPLRTHHAVGVAVAMAEGKWVVV